MDPIRRKILKAGAVATALERMEASAVTSADADEQPDDQPHLAEVR
jgi:hypothetical protein